jgi:hypothetical protein
MKYDGQMLDRLTEAVQRAEMRAEEKRRGWTEQQRLDSLEADANACSIEGECDGSDGD